MQPHGRTLIAIPQLERGRSRFFSLTPTTLRPQAVLGSIPTVDCENGGCVVSAISSYTTQILDSTTSVAELLNAIRFVVHFVGDIHQPLHDEALNVGGNTMDVTYDGDPTNLHAIWDTQIPEQLAGASTQAVPRTLATTLTSAIEAVDYSWDPSSWLEGISVNDTQTSALTWASKANAFVCSDVLVGGISAVERGDLDGAYYKAHSAVGGPKLPALGTDEGHG
jgi:hypothetical protein